ncbi:MAG: hypothetical protein E7277_03620 [Lachnospiraceae bacterium]|nr:hypothetical protein [Lachnospiraceae bacterium]
MERTLGIIQTFSKIGKILSKIAYICCLVGGICCIVGVCSLVIGSDDVIKLGGVTIHGLVEKSANMKMGTIYAAVISGAIGCAGGFVLAMLCGKYFKHELEAGTPFTMGGAKELRRLGIFWICVPVVTRTAMEIVYVILEHFMKVSSKAEVMGDVSGIGIGITLIVVSYLCQYGAERFGDCTFLEKE